MLESHAGPPAAIKIGIMQDFAVAGTGPDGAEMPGRVNLFEVRSTICYRSHWQWSHPGCLTAETAQSACKNSEGVGSLLFFIARVLG